jgi:AcrR family transcriptional regulator
VAVAVTRGRPRSASADLAIVTATLELLERGGYGQLTMAGVAERAGVSTATLYRRVASKEELVVGVLRSLVPERPPVDTGSLEDDLRETLHRIAGTLGGSAGRLLVGVVGEAAGHPALQEVVESRLIAPGRELMLAMLERGVSRGEIPALADPDLAVSLILGPLHYQLIVSHSRLAPDSLDRLVPMLLAALSAG